MDQKQLGKLPPRYHFFLNPYKDIRFTRCPKCNGKTGQRKLPLLIWIDPHQPLSLNYTCRYCSTCDLLIAHQDEIEANLVNAFNRIDPGAIGNEYLVVGTMEKGAWKQGQSTPVDLGSLPEHLHDFKAVWKFEINYGWGPEEELETPSPIKPEIELPKNTLPEPTAIDHLPDAFQLVDKMNAQLPITARPTKELVNMLRKQGVELDRYRDVLIKQVMYMGDEGGITCDITPAGKETTPILCSLTHLLIPSSHSLAQEIQSYQEERIKKLGQDYGQKGITIEPRKRH